MQMAQVEQRGRRGTAGGAAGGAVELPRIARDAREGRMADADPAEFRQRGLAENDRASLAQPRDRGRVGSTVSEPRREGKSFSQTLSFTVAPSPSAKPIGSPLCQRASEACADLSAPSRSTMMKALIAGSNVSMRASWSRVTSTGESSLRR
jgi:hypothetical protein